MNKLLIIQLVLISMFTINAQNKGFHLNGRKVIDAKGNEFIMKGVNHAHTWYESQLGTAIPAIAKTGANCVRVVLSNGKHAEKWGKNDAADLRNVLKMCKDNKLIAIVEVHDCTGYPEKAGAVHLSTAVDYWIEMKNELIGQEAFVILNPANEPFGNKVPASTWVTEHNSAVKRLRDSGFNHLIMIDAANWGQDWEKIMQANASQVFSADSKKNIVFSIHMYDVYSSESIVDSYLKTFVNKGLPLVVGEFAADHGAGKPVAAQAILNKTKEYGIGYIGWSWKGNSSGLESLDIAQNWNGNPLTTWGNLLIKGTNGIKATSQIASVFSTETEIDVTKGFVKGAGPVIVMKDNGVHITLSSELPGKARLIITDLIGCTIATRSVQSGTNGVVTMSFNRDLFQKGTYLIRVENGSSRRVSKMVVSF